MKPSLDAYTVALPWYEREDFDRLWELSDDHYDVPRDYDLWRETALSVVNAWLARGRALQIIAVKPDQLLPWLKENGLPNNADSRRRYVEQLAAGSDGVAGNVIPLRKPAEDD